MNLLELLLVITISTLIGASNFSNTGLEQSKARVQQSQSNMEMIGQKVESFCEDTQRQCTGLVAGTITLPTDYLPTIPTDPTALGAGTSYTYTFNTRPDGSRVFQHRGHRQRDRKRRAADHPDGWRHVRTTKRDRRRRLPPLRQPNGRRLLDRDQHVSGGCELLIRLRPMFEVVEIGLGIACGAWSASSFSHASLIVLVILAPVIAWCDFSTHKIPETLSLPWLAFALAIAFSRLPESGIALLATAITTAVICVMVVSGIIKGKHVLGIADGFVLIAILATLCDSRTFPAPNIFVSMILTMMAASLIALAMNVFQRRLLSAPGPIGGSLAIGAVLITLPTWFLAR